MNTTILKRGIYTAVAIALSAFGASAWAASTWSVLGGCNTGTAYAKCGTTGASASGWSTGTTGTTFAAAQVYNWGNTAGLGVVGSAESATATGPHAVDNAYGIDALLINFTGGAVNLSAVTIGWNGTDNNSTSATYNDSDLSVYVWTESSGPVSGSNLLTSGWTLIGNYADVGASNNTPTTKVADGTATTSSSYYSSYWLISAYSGTSTTGVLTAGNDSFKVLSVAGNTCTGNLSGTTCNTGNKTPEPGSLALLGAGVVGLLVARRRKAIR